MTIHVLQGERPMAAQNKSIGQFNLTGIAPARRGVPQIEVTFDIDANGILKVSAKDKATGKEQAIRIEASSGLSKEEIERMKAEASANAEADKKEREKVDKLNQADSLIFTTENQLKDLGDKQDSCRQESSYRSRSSEIERCSQGSGFGRHRRRKRRTAGCLPSRKRRNVCPDRCSRRCTSRS